MPVELYWSLLTCNENIGGDISSRMSNSMKTMPMLWALIGLNKRLMSSKMTWLNTAVIWRTVSLRMSTFVRSSTNTSPPLLVLVGEGPQGAEIYLGLEAKPSHWTGALPRKAKAEPSPHPPDGLPCLKGGGRCTSPMRTTLTI